MNKLTVNAVYDWINSVAPFQTQEAFDNSGLQVGYPDSTVSRILLTLDVTGEVISEAAGLGADLIISHHPLIFTPQKDLVLARHVPKLLAGLIENRIALISAHTNMDQSDCFSGTVAAAKLLGLTNIRRASPYLFLGDLEKPLTERGLSALITERLRVPARQYGSFGKLVTTLGIAGGAYSEGFEEARAAGAQAYLTGEVRHHHALEAAQAGFVLYDGGHYATEAPMLAPLAFGLQLMANELKCSLQVHVSSCVPYRLQ